MMTNRSRLMPILIFSLVLLLCTRSIAKETWLKLQSKNFTVISNSSEGDARKLATQLELFRHVLSLVFPNAKIETPVLTTVILFDSQTSFKPFRPKYKGKTRDNVAGYFVSSPDVNYVALTSQAGGSNPQGVIFHEYEHFIIHNNLPNAPLCLDEGMAEFFSTFTTLEDNKKARIGNPIEYHTSTLRGEKLIPLETLFTINTKSPIYNEKEKVGVFYAESWAFVHYMMLGNEGKRQSQLTKFIGGLNAGVPLSENFRQAFEADPKTIEKEIQDYVRYFTMPTLMFTFTDQLKVSKEMQQSSITDAEVNAYLGDLLLRSRRFEDAEPYLEKSLQLDPNCTMGLISMGLVRQGQKRLPQAEKLFQSAIASDSHNELGYLHLAQVLIEEERFTEAIPVYKQLIQLKPEVARGYSALGFALLYAGKDTEATEAFQQAIRIDPNNPFLYRRRSHEYLCLARGNLAALDAITYIQHQGWRDGGSPYMLLIAYFGFRQSLQSPSASAILEEGATALDAFEWPYPVLRYLKRLITAEELLGLATDNDKLTEAHAYIGLDLLFAGKRLEALQHLQWVKENGNKGFVEYRLAIAEIGRLEAKKDQTSP